MLFTLREAGSRQFHCTGKHAATLAILLIAVSGEWRRIQPPDFITSLMEQNIAVLQQDAEEIAEPPSFKVTMEVQYYWLDCEQYNSLVTDNFKRHIQLDITLQTSHNFFPQCTYQHWLTSVIDIRSWTILGYRIWIWWYQISNFICSILLENLTD